MAHCSVDDLGNLCIENCQKHVRIVWLLLLVMLSVLQIAEMQDSGSGC